MTTTLARVEPTASDVADCRRWIAAHSRSFYFASLLLPGRVRRGAWALYAFCRRADDTVDGPTSAIGEADLLRRVESLRQRLARTYAGGALADPTTAVDRAFRALAERYRIPRALPEALLAGMEMDGRSTRYRTLDDLYLYCFRVASTVGLMMTQVMGWSRADALLRAADLGIAMQLTNIARDVGEDAARGRVYLPDELLEACGTDAQRVRAARATDAALGEAVRRLLERADAHYAAADRGVALLPVSCRWAIRASRRIYAAIGNDLARHGYECVARRAHTSVLGKVGAAAAALPAWFSRPSPAVTGPADALTARWIDELGLDASPRSAAGGV